MSEQPDPPDPYQCANCAVQYPVPSLARDCEALHRGHPLRAQDVPGLARKRIG